MANFCVSFSWARKDCRRSSYGKDVFSHGWVATTLDAQVTNTVIFARDGIFKRYEWVSLIANLTKPS